MFTRELDLGIPVVEPGQDVGDLHHCRDAVHPADEVVAVARAVPDRQLRGPQPRLLPRLPQRRGQLLLALLQVTLGRGPGATGVLQKEPRGGTCLLAEYGQPCYPDGTPFRGFKTFICICLPVDIGGGKLVN